MPSLRVLLVDDHPAFRASASAFLSTQAHLHVAAEAGSGEEALAFAGLESIDLVLLDLGLPGISGIDTARQLRQRTPASRIIVVTLQDDDEYQRQAIAAGADGFVSKSDFATTLMPQITRLFPTAAGTQSAT